MFTRKCPECKCELTYKQKSQVTEAIKKNRKCASCAAKKVGLNARCEQCATRFYRRPSDMRALNFCSHKCSATYYANKLCGENSPSWKGGQKLSRERSKIANRERRIQLKKLGVDFLGGKCQNCGYDKCIASLDFHHVNPKEKDEDFSRKCDLTWDVMKELIKNCTLLCANCHREHHYNEKNKSHKI